MMLDPIIKTIEVPCSQATAFRVFVNEMGSWWPLDKRSVSMLSGKPAKALRIEPKRGGRIVEIGHDGMPAGSASLVEVRFTALGDERTRVKLTQSNWEAFGELAEMMRSGYGSGWVIIFEQAFKSACGG